MTFPIVSQLAPPPDSNTLSDFAQFESLAVPYFNSCGAVVPQINAWITELNQKAEYYVQIADMRVSGALAALDLAESYASIAEEAKIGAQAAQAAAEGYRDDVENIIAIAAALGNLDPTTANPGDAVIVNAAGDGLEFGAAAIESNAAAWLLQNGYTGNPVAGYSADGVNVVSYTIDQRSDEEIAADYLYANGARGYSSISGNTFAYGNSSGAVLITTEDTITGFWFGRFSVDSAGDTSPNLNVLVDSPSGPVKVTVSIYEASSGIGPATVSIGQGQMLVYSTSGFSNSFGPATISIPSGSVYRVFGIRA